MPKNGISALFLMPNPPIRMRVFRFSLMLFLISGYLLFAKGLWQPCCIMPAQEIASYSARIHWVDSVYNGLTLEERIAQTYMVAVYSGQGAAHQAKITKLVEEHGIGGLIFFKGHPSAQLIWTNHFQSKAEIPLLVAMDAEWGPSMRLDSTQVYPRQLAMGAIRNDALVYDFGYEVGRQLKRLGVHVNLAPVVDINNNPNNPVINDRSFGENKFNVALKSLSYYKGMRDAGVYACVKHFPGHGDTDKDSHKTLPVINHSYKRLKEIELYPFELLINAGIHGVMAAHIQVPELDNTENTAASLSKLITTGLLKDSLNFNGLVYSDALNMKGVSQFYKPGEVDLKAFQAGNDILLFSEDVLNGIQMIKKAIEDSSVSEKHLKKTVKKILRYKYELGLERFDSISTKNLIADLNTPNAITIRQHLYEQSFTLLKNSNNLIPYRDLSYKKFASLAIGESRKNYFQSYLDFYQEVDHYQIGKSISTNKRNEILKTLAKYDEIIISIHDMSRYAARDHGIDKSTTELIKLIQDSLSTAVVVFGSPYSLDKFETIDNILLAYEDNSTTQQFAAQALFNAIPITGKLPVSAGSFKYGMGEIVDDATRLKYSMPEELDLQEADFKLIDYIAKEVISTGVSPGLQVLVAKENKVVFYKGYGHHTYDKKNRVSVLDLYDLASITKIAASTISVMHLIDKGKLDLDKTVDEYLELPARSTIKSLKLRDILTHSAGLQGWIPFYRFTIEDTAVEYDHFYCDDTTDGYCVKVADNLYLKKNYPDSMWDMIQYTAISPSQYRYSDLGYYLIARIVKEITGLRIDSFASKTFYEPMGIDRLTYNPIEKYDLREIAPTEADSLFRKQLVHGYVHDPGAAMMGGVGGHAGLFSNANCLAVIMQMLLNGGTYGGKRYIKKATIENFTAYQSANSRRGLGFDKPQPDPDKVSPTSPETPHSTFGHTGFTGTAAWADPENNLIYIFLSNRVYPDAGNWKLVDKNIRPRIQTVIYQALENKDYDYLIPAKLDSIQD